MVKTRIMPERPIPTQRGEHGRRMCRGGCGKEAGAGRRWWCDDAECLRQYRIRRDPGYARGQVWERDKGTCAKCRQSADRIARIIRYLRIRVRDRPYNPSAWFAFFTHGPRAKYRGWNTYRWGHTWEMDHIVPVIAGGGGCGLENLQTLCIGCHKAETAALAARRAIARKFKAKKIPAGHARANPASVPRETERPR